MDKKPKARRASREAKRSKLEDKEQSKRFIATAMELGGEKIGDAFERAMEAIVKYSKR